MQDGKRMTLDLYPCVSPSSSPPSSKTLFSSFGYVTLYSGFERATKIVSMNDLMNGGDG